MYCFNSFAVGRVTPPVSKRANPLVSGLKAIIRLTAQCPVLQIRKRKGEVAIDGTLQPTEPVIVQDVLAGTLRPFSFFFFLSPLFLRWILCTISLVLNRCGLSGFYLKSRSLFKKKKKCSYRPCCGVRGRGDIPALFTHCACVCMCVCVCVWRVGIRQSRGGFVYFLFFLFLLFFFFDP